MPTPCDQAPVGACSRCDKQACTDHSRVTQAGVLCVQCADPDRANFLSVLGLPDKVYFTPEDVAAFAAREPEGGDEAWLDFT